MVGAQGLLSRSFCSTAITARHDAAGRVTGGKDLASTSAYPKYFCVALFDLWAATLLAAAPASPGLASASEPEVVEIVEVFSSQN